MKLSSVDGSPGRDGRQNGPVVEAVVQTGLLVVQMGRMGRIHRHLHHVQLAQVQRLLHELPPRRFQLRQAAAVGAVQL